MGQTSYALDYDVFLAGSQTAGGSGAALVFVEANGLSCSDALQLSDTNASFGAFSLARSAICLGESPMS